LGSPRLAARSAPLRQGLSRVRAPLPSPRSWPWLLLAGDAGGAGGGAAGLFLRHPSLRLHRADGQQVFPPSLGSTGVGAPRGAGPGVLSHIQPACRGSQLAMAAPAALPTPSAAPAAEGLWQQRRALSLPCGPPRKGCTGGSLRGGLGHCVAGLRGEPGQGSSRETLARDASALTPFPICPSFERLLLHALCQYLDLVSASKSLMLVCLCLVLFFPSSLSLLSSSASSSSQPHLALRPTDNPALLPPPPAAPSGASAVVTPLRWCWCWVGSIGRGRGTQQPGRWPGPALPGAVSLTAVLPFLPLLRALGVPKQEAAHGAGNPRLGRADGSLSPPGSDIEGKRQTKVSNKHRVFLPPELLLSDYLGQMS